MRRTILLLLALALATAAGAITPRTVAALQACNSLPFNGTSAHLLGGRPVLLVNEADAPQNIDLVIREDYEFRNNGNTKFIDWIAYKLDGTTFGNAGQPNYGNDLCLSPSRTLQADPSDEDDYINALSTRGYARAHLASPDSLASSPNRFDLDLYSKLVPMHEALVGAWNEFEEVIRDYVVREGKTAYILAGTEYKNEMPALPNADEDHQVPSGFWKFIYID